MTRLPDSNLCQLIQQITQLKFDEKNFQESFSKLRECFLDILNNHVNHIYKTSIDQGQSLYRARKHPTKALFNSLIDLSYPPPQITKLGRANLPNWPVYYCSDNSSTSLLECKPEESEYINLIEMSSIRRLNLCVVGISNRYEKEVSIVNGLALFSKAMSEWILANAEEDYDYLKTAALCNMLLSDNSYDGILYPSIHSRMISDNIALSIKDLDRKIEFVSATQLLVTEKKSNSHIQVMCKNRSTSLKSGDLAWRKVENCKGHSIRFDENDWKDFSH